MLFFQNPSLYFLLIACVSLVNLKAQTENQIFAPGILSPAVHPPEEPLLPPIVELFSQQQLEISFDDLNHNTRDLSYRVLHCSAMWEKSDLLDDRDDLRLGGRSKIGRAHV